jgi:predicted RNA-binding protein Jag
MATAKTVTKKTVKTARKPASKTTKKVTLDDVWETIREIGVAHKETEAALKETQAAHKETEAALKETQRIVGDLGNKFGDEAEYTMLPGLPEKFKQFGFDFGVISRNRKINNDEHDIHTEIDAFLENGTQAMAVEVKAKLQNSYVDDHIKRMEKIRKYADLYGDKREFFGALAAVVVDEKSKNYALENGFYVIEPSGEDVKVIKPGSHPKVW